MPSIAVVTLVALVGARFAARVGVEHDNVSLNADDAEQALVYAGFKEAFGNDEDLLVALTHRDLLSASGLALVDELSREIASYNFV